MIRRYLSELSRLGLAGCVVLTALAAGCLGPGETKLQISDAAVRPPAAVASEPSVTAAAIPSSTTTRPPASPGGPVAAVTGTLHAERGDQVAVGAPPVVAPVPVPGDCLSWSAVFVWRGASAAEIEFFFADGTIERETGCGRDLLNEATGDSGICQVNPVHNRPGWFGGREFGTGGWLHDLHGLHVREDLTSPAWVDACLTLFRVCGPGPWDPPYSCSNNRLEDAA